MLPIPPSYVFHFIEERRREPSNSAGKKQRAGALEKTRRPLNTSKRRRPAGMPDRLSLMARWRHPRGAGRRVFTVLRKFRQNIVVWGQKA